MSRESTFSGVQGKRRYTAVAVCVAEQGLFVLVRCMHHVSLTLFMNLLSLLNVERKRSNLRSAGCFVVFCLFRLSEVSQGDMRRR
mmetsp:Transcript_55421/g.108495  ORF Transcript_55421/g.108495 Transcript_55421/m.108495 type:complete len:85 (+) Transcript_55421:63-317(+)